MRAHSHPRRVDWLAVLVFSLVVADLALVTLLVASMVT